MLLHLKSSLQAGSHLGSMHALVAKAARIMRESAISEASQRESEPALRSLIHPAENTGLA